MTDFTVDFLGCKVSQTDAEGIREALLTAGHHESSRGHIRVVNACCVTAEAERKSRRKVRRMLEVDGEPGSAAHEVFVTGCGAGVSLDAWSEIGGKVTLLPGGSLNVARSIVEAADRLSGLGCKGPGDAGRSGRGLRTLGERTRAFIKIQDGCNFNCSYCIVPSVRGVPRSRTIDAIRRDIEKRVARGQSEIVLTGINIGLFRDEETRIGLAGLLPLVGEIDGVERIRISSIESNHVNRRLVEAMNATPQVCNHLHVPMQSGSNVVLAEMGRHYKADGWLRSVQTAHDVLGSDFNLTTDVIVGHPAETDDEFERTVELVERSGCTKVHCFPYSSRPGTVDHGSDTVSASQKSERSTRVREVASREAMRRWTQRIGKADEVLYEVRNGRGESSSDGRGYTRNYFPVKISSVFGADDSLDGKVVQCIITGVDEEGLRAKIEC